MLELKGNEIFIDGQNAGRVCDAKANYPHLAAEIDALVAESQRSRCVVCGAEILTESGQLCAACAENNT